ncbi:MAG: hypothetical protein ABSA91_16375 [Acidimicrobiales bacterium]|jgi:hypothetical protein
MSKKPTGNVVQVANMTQATAADCLLLTATPADTTSTPKHTSPPTQYANVWN